MSWSIIIDFQPKAGVHRIHNFGEALYTMCRADRWASISLADVDRSTTQLVVSVRVARRVRRIRAKIEDILERHHLADEARISVVNDDVLHRG